MYNEIIESIAYDAINIVFPDLEDEDIRADLRARVRAGEGEKVVKELGFEDSLNSTPTTLDSDDLSAVPRRYRFESMDALEMINKTIGVRRPHLDNSEMATKGICIYVASSARDGRAAVCARMTYGGKAKNIVFTSNKSTAPKAIAVGILKAISALKHKRRFVTVYTAASYLDGFDIYAAQERGWMTKSKKPMASVDVWKEILTKIQEGGHIVLFRKTDTGARDYNTALLQAKRVIAGIVDNEAIRQLVEAGNTPINIKEAPSFEDIFGRH